MLGGCGLGCDALRGGDTELCVLIPVRVKMLSSSLFLRNWSKEMLHGGEVGAPGK